VLVGRARTFVFVSTIVTVRTLLTLEMRCGRALTRAGVAGASREMARKINKSARAAMVIFFCILDEGCVVQRVVVTRFSRCQSGFRGLTWPPLELVAGSLIL
jgi:hypothetical protein